MAARSNKKEEQKGPKAYEVIIGAFLSIFLGVLLAVVYLVVQPVEEVEEPPADAERDRRTVYFVEGAEGSAVEVNWRPKYSAFEAGAPGTLELSEEELNQWVAVQYPDLDEEDPDGGMVSIAPRSLNFRIYDGVLQVGSELHMEVMGVGRTVRAQAHGDFVQRNGGFVFEAERVYLGGFKVPHEALGELIMNRVYDSFEIPDELRDAWNRLALVTVVDNRLILEIP